MARITLIISVLITSLQWVYTQEVWMHPNAGQWDDRIEYKVDLQMGEMYIEKDGFTYFLNDAVQKMRHSHDGDLQHGDMEQHEEFDAHVIRSKFKGSSWSGVSEVLDSSTFYNNYFIGNDKSKWKSNLYCYSRLSLVNFYDGIDLIMDGRNQGLKYSLVVEPGVDPNQIVMHYEGQDALFVDDEGNLHVTNRFGEIIEKTPLAWVEGDKRAMVDVKFQVNGNDVIFVFPKGYDVSQKLTIDPNLTFSTFTGSTADNWGMTATPDVNGNLFAGGTIFNNGVYPTNVGAFSSSHSGGTVDIGITKFTADGTNILYSTYLGGSGDETPNSIVSAPNGELYIFGLTSSANFPMAGASYDASYNGGPNLAGSSNGLGFSNGSDLYVVRMSADGSSLIASTYIGGSGNDGLNNSNLKYNYGDQFRGEIILDDNGFVYVASMTQSVDFPTQAGAQSAINGAQDAVLFKMPPTLNAMVWSTFYGGSGSETGNSVQIAANGDVYMAGGTTSNNMGFAFGHDLSYDGQTDGYVARFNGVTGGALSGTYIGANEYDQTYFVQIDIDDNVYVLGQTETNLGVTAGHYGIPNSGQFIRKYDHNLNSLFWTTMIGAGSGHVEISPTAFLVSDCYDIYLSGWGGTLNADQDVSQAIYSSTFGFPVTADAFQPTTDGSSFYIAVLSQDAMNLKYGTYMGGFAIDSPNHVDGGTSRFDKSGRIYHAVCAACGGDPNGFTTTPGVWAPQNPSPNCNLAAFKFELSTIEAVIATPDPLICLPDPVIFNNNSANGNAFFWDFGDNTTSTDVNPTHFYAGPGTYTVTLVVTDTNGCFSADSIEFIINIGDFQGGVVTPANPICPGVSYQLEAFGGASYLWSPDQVLDDPTISMPTATLFQTTDFMVVISDSCGIDTAYVTVPVFDDGADVSNDTSICIGNSVALYAIGGVSYVWSPATYLDNPNSATPVSIPTADIAYNVEITTANNCVLNETVLIEVYYTTPIPIMPDSLTVCRGESLDISVFGGQTYFWYPNSNISAVDTNVVTVTPPNDITYYCDLTNACGTATDSVLIEVVIANITAGNDTIICHGESVNIWALGGVSYEWWPGNTLNNTVNSWVTATPTAPTTYYVLGTDQFGCTAVDSVWIDLFPLAFIQTSPDVYAFYGDEIQLSATSTTSGPYIWSPAEFLSCVVCPDPIAQPDQNYSYVVSYTDNNGCVASDTVNIYYDPILYIPNTFTPDSESLNTVFKAEGGNIKTFEMLIFNRWGELIYTISDFNDSWDGKYKGEPCQDGTYIWTVTLTGFDDEEHMYTGHVNLLR
ncbi:MAG: gliding motility-associated C-terminal domain-containing protein [Crocinitomicaceae bacterium]|nr:gliding motility-associated C-terminal domain-containing protein [Crocinitomicaceae bacterium]